MAGTLAELYGAILRQRNEPQGVLGAARINPLMMAKALRQQEAHQPPTSVMDPRWDAFKKNQDAADTFLTASDIAMSVPMLAPVAKVGALALGKAAGPLAEQYMARTGMLQPMTVWQGSPHRFAPTKNNPLGEFDATKIGSGEGAQAYGYGHYLAENKNVADEYARKLSGAQVDFGGKSLKEVSKVLTPEEKLTAEWVERSVSGMQYGYQGAEAERISKLLAEKNPSLAKKLGKIGVFDSGSIYKVDLPDEHISKMLDWDKPLSQQPESVRQALKNAPFETGGGDWTGRDLLEMAQAYAKASQSGKYVVGGVDPKAGSDLLKSLGIPGIRYLDGGSRAGGQGTSNFVVFPGNEGILKILSRE